MYKEHRSLTTVQYQQHIHYNKIKNGKIEEWKMLLQVRRSIGFYVLKLVVWNHILFNKVVIDKLNTIIVNPIN